MYKCHLLEATQNGEETYLSSQILCQIFMNVFSQLNFNDFSYLMLNGKSPQLK